MNYIMSPLQEDISVIDKLYGLLENALIDYEYQTLLESETSTSTSNDSKENKARTLKTVLNTILTKIKKLFDKIGNALSNMMKNIIGSHIYYVAKNDIEVGPYTRDKFPESICNKILAIKNNTSDDEIESLEDDLDKCIDEEETGNVIIMEGLKVDVAQCIRHLKTNNKYIKLIEQKSKSDNSDDPKVFRIYKKLIRFLTAIGKNLSAIISNCALFKTPKRILYLKNNDKTVIDSKLPISRYDKMMRNYNKAHGIKNESILFPEESNLYRDDLVTKNEYIASIMLEAAELLKNDNEYELDSILTEAVEYDNDNIYYLNEAVNELKEIDSIKKEMEKGIDDGKLNKMISKIKRSIDNLLKWYYKIEPNKKLKALHTVLRGIDITLNIGLSMVFAASTFRGIDNAITYAKEQAYGNSVFKAAEVVADDFNKRGMNVNFSAKDARKALRKNSIYGKRTKRYVIIAMISAALIAISSSLRKYSNEKFNIADYDNNIKEIKSQINKINTKIKNAGDDKESVDQLNKLKNKYNSMLDQLIVMKDSYNNFGKGGL